MSKSKILIAFSVIFLSINCFSQDERFEQRYNLLVSRLGESGVGVETLIDRWEAADSLNPKVYMARFNYWLSKSREDKVVQKYQKKYLGMEPLLSLKDSTGVDVYYFQESFYDDEGYGNAIKAIDKAISLDPDNLGFRFAKANAYIAYEKGSPDMALAYLIDLTEQFGHREWSFDGKKVDNDFLADAMQEYCYSFYSLGTPSSMEAFLILSEKLSAIFPQSPDFQNNIGAYWLVGKQDAKKALKQYSKVLKKFPSDYTAIKNCIIISRRDSNTKQEIKFLKMMLQHGPEAERMAAQHRMDALQK